ncbi:22kda glycoprotein [Fusarium heterosporum]|uniref:22kda glycoprotein n=1 Tax=Fusarium heterosporum TaxID=42747 RepID=A0A8H5T6L2_FUSHE|nr:22kda glycoprotein [Fusarium heterosporum]
MKFFATALFAATAVSAAYPVFEVHEFSAGCIPHSANCKYSFEVIQSGSMESWEGHPVKCSALVQSNNGLLPDVKEAQCEESSRTFDIVRSKKGLTFSVSQPVSPISNTTAKHVIPNKELWVSKQPNAEVQAYKGAKAFKLY